MQYTVLKVCFYVSDVKIILLNADVGKYRFCIPASFTCNFCLILYSELKDIKACNNFSWPSGMKMRWSRFI